MEVFGGDVLERGELVDARVVDQDVETTEGLPRLGEEPIDLLLLRHVGLHRDGLTTTASDVGDHAVGTLLAGGIVDDDGGAGLGPMPGGGGADPPGGPGDVGHLVAELAHVAISSVPRSWEN